MFSFILKFKLAFQVFLLAFCCVPINALADAIQKISYAEYNKNIAFLKLACSDKGLPSFSGFCLSQEYGKVSMENPVQTSITIALQAASFEYFNKNCDHSEIASATNTLDKAKKLLETQKYYAEIVTQTEALKNYASQFTFCKAKTENDAKNLNQLKWFEMMIEKIEANVARETALNNKINSIINSQNATEWITDFENERFSVICESTKTIDSACLLKIGKSGRMQPIRFIAAYTQYSHLLNEGLVKALTPKPNFRQFSNADTQMLKDLILNQCHPAAESQGSSGDLLQMCIPSDSTKIVLFMSGLCDRCEFEPFILKKQVLK